MRTLFLFALQNCKRLTGKSTISVHATYLTFGCSRENALTYYAHYCGAPLGDLNCMKNWSNFNDTGVCAARIRVDAHEDRWKRSKIRHSDDETCEITAPREGFLSRLTSYRFRKHTSTDLRAREIGQNSRKKKNIDRQYKRVLEPNGRSAQCQIIFHSRNTRRRGREGTKENEDHQFSQALHIDLRYVFKDFDLGDRGGNRSRSVKNTRFCDRDNELNATLDYLLSKGFR